MPYDFHILGGSELGVCLTEKNLQNNMETGEGLKRELRCMATCW